MIDGLFVLISDRRFVGKSRDVSLNVTLDRAIDGSLWRAFAILEKIVEQLSIVDDRGSKVLRARGVSLVTFGNLTCGSIIIDEPRMMNGEIAKHHYAEIVPMNTIGNTPSIVTILLK